MNLFSENNDDGKSSGLPKKDDELTSLKFRNLLQQQRYNRQIKKAEEEKEEAALRFDRQIKKAEEEKEVLQQQRYNRQIKKAEEEKEEAALRFDRQIKKAEEEKEEAALKAKEEKDEAALKLKKATNCNELMDTMLGNMNKSAEKSKKELSLKKELVERIYASKNEQASELEDSKLKVNALKDSIESLETSKKEQAIELEEKNATIEVDLQDSRRRNEEMDGHIQAHIQTIIELEEKNATIEVDLQDSRRRNEEMDGHIQAHIQTIKETKALANAADTQLAIKDTQLTLSRAGEEAAEIRVQSTLQDGVESLEAETKLKTIAEGNVDRLQTRVTTLKGEATLQGESLEAETKLKTIAEGNVDRLQTRVTNLEGEATLQGESLEAETNLKAIAEGNVVRLQSSLGKEKKLRKEADILVTTIHEMRSKEKETLEQEVEGLQFKYKQAERAKRTLSGDFKSTTNDLMNAKDELKLLKNSANDDLMDANGKLKTSEVAKDALDKKLQQAIKALKLAKDGTRLEFVIKIDKSPNYEMSKLQELTELAELLYKKFSEKDLPTNKDDEDFPFPLKEFANGDDLFATIVEIKSDQNLFRTFSDLIWNRIFNDKSPETYDIFLSFNGWIGTNFFDPRNALNCENRTKRKRDETSQDTAGVSKRSSPKPKAKSSAKKKVAVAVESEKEVESAPSSKRATRASTTSTTKAKKAKPSAKKKVAVAVAVAVAKKNTPASKRAGKILLTYTATGNEKAGSLINWTGNHGDARQSEPILLYEQKEPIKDGRWLAYKLKEDGTGGLRCPFCKDSYRRKGFTNHAKSCTRNPKSKNSKKNGA